MVKNAGSSAGEKLFYRNCICVCISCPIPRQDGRIQEETMKQTHLTIQKGLLLTILLFCMSLLIAMKMGCSSQSGDSASAPVGDTGSADGSQVLARVEVPGDISEIPLPIYEVLDDNNDVYYALVISTEADLKNAGVTYTVISQHLTGADYLLAESGRSEAYADAVKTGKVLYNDGHWIIARYEPDLEETFAEMGFDVVMLSQTPMLMGSKGVMKAAQIVKITKVEQLMARIGQSEIDGYLKDLSGENSVTVGSDIYTLTTRHTESGITLDHAIKYVIAKLREKSLKAHDDQTWKRVGNNPWTNETKSFTGRNIVAEITGKTTPKEIVVLIAHLDSVNNNSLAEGAPGADDDGSGCAALMAVARNLYDCTFDRTIRFVFTTGEEQGVLGGSAYVDEAAKVTTEKIILAINLDMIAYNGKSGETTTVQRVKLRKEDVDRDGYNADIPFARNYRDVVKTYGLNSSIDVEITADQDMNSDQAPFWKKRIPAVWLIENDYDYSLPKEQAYKYFNATYMHTTEDKLSKCLTGGYYTAVVKALLGLTAHEAGIQ